MKTLACMLGLAVVLAACESPPARSPYYTRGSASTSTSAAPLTSTSATANAGVPASQRPPDAELLYQSTASDAFGSSTYTSRTQVRGPVVEEVHIGNQRVDPYQPIYPATSIDGAVQPGYVPTGTQWVIDPRTGQRLPVRRR